MSKSLNKIQLIGFLGHDPELKVTPKGKSYANLSVGTTDGVGDYVKTNWHRVVLWGKTAEVAAQYLTKGSQIYVEGVLGYSEFEKSGVKVTQAQITGFQVIFLGSGKKQGSTDKAPEEAPW